MNNDYFVSPLQDFAFSQIFGNQQNIDNTRDFLKALLDIPKEDYDKLTIVNPILGRMSKKEKTAVVDVLLNTKSGRIIHIELQVEKRRNMRNRIMYYAARNLSDQLKWGNDYKKINQAISVVICDHNLLEEEDSYINEYMLRNDKKHCFTELMKVIILELPKLPETEDGTIWRWMKFLKCSGKEDYEMLRRKYPELEKPIVCAKRMSLIQSIRYLHMQRVFQKADEENLREQIKLDGRAEGLAEGLAEGKVIGIAEGRAEGIAEGKREVALRLKKMGLSYEQIAEGSGLPLDEIQKL
ncbi:MAG: Rpn family recombination-promoting nuclease/putative transposase [Treponema sp.]|jgi:predicted transposase/invertase (TIGR01784 family)|nr:Rpn family recombination-promoting nuclease/putative transposase [Treponema sp.]